MVEECQELRLSCETLTSSIKTAELDSKAGRETILRLVAEGKKQEKGKEEARQLQHEVERLEGEVEQQRAALMAQEQERAGIQDRLKAAKETHGGTAETARCKGRKVRTSPSHSIPCPLTYPLTYPG